MSDSNLDPLPKLMAPLQDIWHSLFSGALVLADEQDLTATVRIPIIVHKNVRGWLNANISTQQEPIAAALLQGWAGMASQYLAENQTAQDLTEDLITAWNRQSFLNDVIALMRTTTDTRERSLRSLELAAQVLRVENAFISRNTREGLQTSWLGPDPWGDSIRPVIALLRDHGGRVLCNDPNECQRILGVTEGALSFLGQQCDTHDAPGLFVGMVNSMRGKFSAGDIQMFEGLVAILKTFSETNLLHRQQEEAQRVNRDLEIAAEIQATLLPSQLPPLPDYDVAATMIPASRLGGDFYDVVDCGPENLVLVVADVAGKGIPAALLAAELRAVIRAILGDRITPSMAITRANAELYDDLERIERFATVALVQVPLTGSEFSYASAGHATILQLNDAASTISMLPSTTLPLGVVNPLESESVQFSLTRNDILCVYSDGLTETEDATGRMFGIKRVAQTLMALRHAPAHLLLKGLVDSARQHRQSAPQLDDLTVAILKKIDLESPSALYQDHLHLVGNLEALPRVGQRLAVIREYIHEGDVGDKWLLEVELAVTEAVSNIIRHAYRDMDGEVDGLVSLFEDRLEIELIDRGLPRQTPTPKPTSTDMQGLHEGGYGMTIISSVMDSVDYQRLPNDLNWLRMIRAIPK